MLTTLALTDAGWRALSLGPPHTGAAAVLAAWDGQDNRDTDIIATREAPIANPRTQLAGKLPRPDGTSCKPRQETKQQAVLDMLRRPQGTNIAQIVAATAWAQHTVRGFLAN